MLNQKILIVNEGESLSGPINTSLSEHGFFVRGIKNERLSTETITEISPDLILIDLPVSASYLDLVTNLKSTQSTTNIPIIVLSSSEDPQDLITTLESGADDFLTKPVDPEVLTARIKLVMRKHLALVGKDTEILKLEKLSIDLKRHEVKIDDNKIELTAGEFNLLRFLASKRGEVFTRSQIIKTLHGPDYGIAHRAVDVQLAGIRSKLGSYASYLETVRGVGYRFRD